MTLFSSTRTLRNTVSAVLLVWVSALGAGWANACLVQPDRTDSRSTAAAPESAGSGAGMPSGLVIHALSAAGHDESAAASSASCPEASDAGSQGLVGKSTALDPTDPAAAPLLALAWTTVGLIMPTTMSASAVAPTPAGPPLRIRYSRLTL